MVEEDLWIGVRRVYSVSIVDQYGYHGSVQCGLQISGPRERFPIYVGCSLMDHQGGIHDLPARWLSSPGLALWKIDAKEQDRIFFGGQVEGWSGRVIFALYTDDTHSVRLADTGWVNWRAPWLIGSSTWALNYQDDTIRSKYGDRLDVWGKYPPVPALPFKPVESRFPGRADLPISGPRHFVKAVTAVLDELEEKAPRRYREAVEYLPEARWDDSIEARANSGGRFRINVDDPEFPYTFLHEVGHNVAGHSTSRSSLDDKTKEREAFAYEDIVARELGRKPRRRS